MKWAYFATAFTASWALVANVFSKIPFASTALKVMTGPVGMVLGPVMQGIIDALTSVLNFVLAFVKVFFDGLKITLKNLSVLAVIFSALVGGVAYGIHLDRSYLPVRVAKVSDCKVVIAELHKNYTFIPKRKR